MTKNTIKKLDFTKYNGIRLAKQLQLIAIDVEEAINAIIDELDKK